MHKLKSNKAFTSVDDMIGELSKVLPSKFTQLGFIEPGHGLRGKTQWLHDDDDLRSMYAMYAGKRSREIILWCLKDACDQSGSKKHAATAVNPKDQGPKEKKAKEAASHYKSSISEVEVTIDQLREKHGNLYTTEQLNCWAHMYQTKKHGSLDDPPDLPYFKAATKAKKSVHASSASDPSVPSTSAPTAFVSPSKRVQLRTECIKQLELWHSLLEKGGISKEQYEDIQLTILDDMK